MRRNLSPWAHVEASLLAVKHPKCAACGRPNPQALRRCACGAGLEIATEIRTESSIVAPRAFDRFAPLHARLLIRVGLWLGRLAKRIEGG